MVKSVAKLIQIIKPNLAAIYDGSATRLTMEQFATKHQLLEIADTSPFNVGILGGEKSYAFRGNLALLERALTRWTMNELITKFSFTPTIVPNILYDDIIERCGFPTKSVRNQVYKIAGSSNESILNKDPLTTESSNKTHTCIAGTSEFALASIHIGDTIPADELPKRYCALSRCYRAETSHISTESKLYRVHYFNKVEMFTFVDPSKSEKTLLEFVDIQKHLFDQLELHYRVLDMPEEDLGLSAKKKIDIEAYMDARGRFGEISSASNCEDYQSSRLNIKYSKMVEKDDELQVETNYVHTINATACATTRLLIALIEQRQTMDGKFIVPQALTSYMHGIKELP